MPVSDITKAVECTSIVQPCGAALSRGAAARAPGDNSILGDSPVSGPIAGIAHRMTRARCHPGRTAACRTAPASPHGSPPSSRPLPGCVRVAPAPACRPSQTCHPPRLYPPRQPARKTLLVTCMSCLPFCLTDTEGRFALTHPECPSLQTGSSQGFAHFHCCSIADDITPS